jgi:chemotaxis signal transduction protein
MASQLEKGNMHENEQTTGGLLVTGFTLGDAAFGVDARLVQEVVKVGELTRVHGAPADVVGIRNLRGRRRKSSW